MCIMLNTSLHSRHPLPAAVKDRQAVSAIVLGRDLQLLLERVNVLVRPFSTVAHNTGIVVLDSMPCVVNEDQGLRSVGHIVLLYFLIDFCHEF